MKSMKSVHCFWPIALLYFFNIVPGSAQVIELKYTELLNNKVVLHYNLVDSVPGRFFTIRLYSSNDTYLNPLEKISGDVGFEVKPGPDKKIIWDAEQELDPGFEGKVSLEIRGRVFIPFINLEQINHYKVFKRNREYNLTWSGGSTQNILNFDLLRGEQKVTTFPNISNVGHHTLEFPPHIKPGRNYRFRVSDAKNKDEVVNSHPFHIKRKIPLLLKAVGVLAIGGALYMLKPAPEEPDIPEAIIPKD